MSISTYSNTLSDAQFGHSPRDPDLKQINYTIICDQRSDNIAFSHLFNGGVSSVSDTLRTNIVSDAFETLTIFRQRNMIEQDFNHLKNWLDGDRLRVGAISVQGKLLANSIGTALRMMVLYKAKRQENRQRLD